MLKNKTLKGLSENTIVTISNGLLEIISFSIFSRILTKEEIGLYAIIQAIRFVSYSISEAGLGASIIQSKHEQKSFLLTVFTLSFIIGLFLSTLLYISSNTIAQSIINLNLNTEIKIISLSVLFNSLASVPKAIMTKKLKFIKIGIIDFITYLFSFTCLGVLLVFKGFGVIGIVIAITSNSFFRMLLYFLYSRFKPGFCLDRGYIYEIFNFAGWLTISRIVSSLYLQIDKIILGKIMPIDLLGIYARITEFIRIVSTKLSSILDQTLFPILSTIQNDHEKQKRVFGTLLNYSSIFSSILLVLFVTNSKLIILVILGESWLEYSFHFEVFTLFILFNFISKIIDSTIRSKGKTRIIFIYQSFSLILFSVAIICGSFYQLWGLIIASVIAYYVILAMKIYIIMRAMKIAWKFIFYQIKNSLLLLMIFVTTYLPLIRVISNIELTLQLIISFIYFIIYLILLLKFPKLMGKEIDITLKPIYIFVKHKLLNR